MGIHKKQQLLVSDEGTFAEFINATGSLTWEKQLAVWGVSPEPQQMREPDQAQQARLAKKDLGHKGARRAKLRFSTYWIGHQSDPTGALTETFLQQLLGDGLGGNSVAEVGGAAAAAATATSLTFTGATLVRGGVVRVGALGDGRAEGEPAVIAVATTTPAALLTALPAAPNAADVIRACQLAYFADGAALVNKRFAVMHEDTGNQIVYFGCQLKSAKLGTPIGGMPTVDLEYECAYWERVAITFPSALALPSRDCAPIAGGSFFIQTVGTTTRAIEVPGELEISIELGLEPIPGIGGSGAYQWITGWARTACDVTIRMRLPWATAWQTLWDLENPAMTKKHILCRLNRGDGRCVGFYAPNVFPSGQRPSAPSNLNEQTYVDVELTCDEGPDTTNDLTRSAIRLFAS